jgi:hypothetical protein
VGLLFACGATDVDSDFWSLPGTAVAVIVRCPLSLPSLRLSSIIADSESEVLGSFASARRLRVIVGESEPESPCPGPSDSDGLGLGAGSSRPP